MPFSDLLPLFLGEYGSIANATQPYLSGPVGLSPIMRQAIDQFQSLTQPIIQQQFALQGNGNSPALPQALGVSLGNVLVPLMQQDMQNRLAAINLSQQRVGGAGELAIRGDELTLRGDELTLRGDEQQQLAALRAAQIADAAAGRQLQGLGLTGQFGQYAGNQMSNLSDQLRQRQELSLKAYGSAGEAQRNVQQQAYDSAYADYLRRQALSEQTTTGLFGGSVLPPTISQTSRTKTSSSK